MSDLSGRIRFNAARFRGLAKMAEAEANRIDNIYSQCHQRGKAQAFELAASQTDSLLTDDFSDFLEAEEEKSKLEELLEVVRAGITARQSRCSYSEGGRYALKEIEMWITEALK